MEWTDTVIVLRVSEFRESDLWLQLLSRKHGVYSVCAFGGRRSRRRFCGCLDVFNTLSCRCKRSRNGQFVNIEEAVLLRGPQLLRSDWQRKGLAANCARFIEAMNISCETGDAAFQLFSQLLTVLEQAKTLSPLLALFFRLRLASDIGFAPDFTACATCGRASGEKNWFLVNEGQLRCAHCGGAHAPYSIEITVKGLDLLRRVQQESLALWDAGFLQADVRNACARVIDGFVQYHLGVSWDEGRFRRV